MQKVGNHRGGGARTTTPPIAASSPTPATVTLREISLTVPRRPKGVNVGRRRGDARRPRDPHARAAGESFEKLAAELSDSPSRANGGLIGPLNQTELAPAAAEAARADEGRRRQRAAAHAEGLPDPEARDDDTAQTLQPFEQAPSRSPSSVFDAASEARVAQVPRRSCAAEAIIEWKNDELQEGLRGRPPADAARARAAGPAPATARRADRHELRPTTATSPVVRHLDAAPSRAGRARADRPSAASKRFCRPSPAGAAGRTARRRSTGRCFPATASRGSRRRTGCRS